VDNYPIKECPQPVPFRLGVFCFTVQYQLRTNGIAMECPLCKNEVQDVEIVCPFCSRSLRDMKQCRACGKFFEIRIDSRACPYCSGSHIYKRNPRLAQDASPNEEFYNSVIEIASILILPFEILIDRLQHKLNKKRRG